VDQAEKEKLEAEAIKAAIAESLLTHQAKAHRVLTPHVRAAVKVKWDGNTPLVVGMVTCRQAGKECRWNLVRHCDAGK
jgi:hypothetical protein